ncbi:MAG: hypothetical protein U0836_11125 [Pirellulales bacterium]
MRPQSRRTPARLVLRAKIVLAAAEGSLNQDIAAARDVAEDSLVVRRALGERRLAGIDSMPLARPQAGDSDARDRDDPAQNHPGETGWSDAPSTRTMAKAVGGGRSTVTQV